MNRDDLPYYLALEKCPGIGAVSYRQIVESLEISLKQLFELPGAEMAALGFNPAQINHLKSPDASVLDETLKWLDSSDNHHLLAIDDGAYPDLLKEIRDAPPLLYAIGRIELLNTPQIAIVGSRNCTPGGASTAEDFSRYLANAGLTITSGMALGIDKHAHMGALAASPNTIAVVGTGIDRIYPSRNKQLAYDIAEKGLIVAEFPVGTKPHSSNFPKRNRIISGLSLAVLVVEATRKSGSLITARLGMEQGREVFAIPGSIHNPQAKGCHHLIRQGAKLVDQAADIIEDIGSLLGYVAEKIEPAKCDNETQLEPEYQQLLDSMGYDPISIDTLVECSGLTIEQLSSMLLILELNDFIQPAPGGLYLRC
jgi:DNA processing protein